MQKKLNIHYGSIHGTYWMFFGVFYSFSSIFLLGRGYSNAQIGLILAIGNILAVLLQPFLGDLADRSKKISVFNIMEGIAAILMICVVMLFIIRKSSPGLSFFYMMIISWIMILQPFCNALAGKLEECGVVINFGACRSIGSLAYAILTGLLGSLVEKKGIMVIPVTGEITLILFMAATLWVARSFNKGMKTPEKPGNRYREESEAHGTEPAAGSRNIDIQENREEINLGLFIKRHKMFLLLNIGVLGVFFGNATVNTYMAQLTSAVGGDSGDVGRIFALLAFLEIPTMVSFSRLSKKFTLPGMMKFSAVAFVLWTGGCAIAKNVGMLLMAQLFQPFAFALFLPTMVKFIGETMEKGEAVKGQTLYTTATTTASIFASLAGGALLDLAGAKTLITVATILTAIGAAIIILNVNRAEKEGAGYGAE